MVGRIQFHEFLSINVDFINLYVACEPQLSTLPCKRAVKFEHTFFRLCVNKQQIRLEVLLAYLFQNISTLFNLLSHIIHPF
jgi:hypothetical protein